MDVRCEAVTQPRRPGLCSPRGVQARPGLGSLSRFDWSSDWESRLLAVGTVLSRPEMESERPSGAAAGRRVLGGRECKNPGDTTWAFTCRVEAGGRKREL